MTYEVANQSVKNGSEHDNKSMKTGHGNQPGLRGTYLATAGELHTASSVTAGTLGAGTGAGKNGTPITTAPDLPGMVSAKMGKKAETLSASGKPMKEGKSGGTTKGVRGTYL